MLHASDYVIVNATRYATRIATTSREGKVLIFKPEAPSFHAIELI